MVRVPVVAEELVMRPVADEGGEGLEFAVEVEVAGGVDVEGGSGEVVVDIVADSAAVDGGVAGVGGGGGEVEDAGALEIEVEVAGEDGGGGEDGEGVDGEGTEGEAGIGDGAGAGDGEELLVVVIEVEDAAGV